MDFLGLKSVGSLLRDTAQHALEVLYSQHLQAFVSTVLSEMQKGARQGRLGVRMGLVQRPYGVGIEPTDSLKASEQLAKLFDYGVIDDDLVQVMAVRECRYEVQRRLQTQGLLCDSSYSHGDIYGQLVPVHAWFVVGLESNVVDDYTQDVRRMLDGWRPHSLSSAPT